MDAYEQRYLKFLRLQPKKPSLDFLKEIIAAQLQYVPYENITKLIRVSSSQFSLPSFEEYVERLDAFGFGGTCFTQNLFLARLLKALGFEVTPVRMLPEDVSHVSLRVKLDSLNYFVDVGLMAPFAGPYLLNPAASFEMLWGNHRFVFLPDDDRKNYALMIHRDGKIIRSYQSTSKPLTDEDLEAGIRKTFNSSALFMTVLCVLRVYETHSVGLWNKTLYTVQGQNKEQRLVEDLSDLKTVFDKDLGLPHIPFEEALRVMKSYSGVDIFKT